MRGADYRHEGLFSYVRPDSVVPKDHPLRAIRRVADAAPFPSSGSFRSTARAPERWCRRIKEKLFENGILYQSIHVSFAYGSIEALGGGETYPFVRD
jgi:hypothetical protein